MKAKFIIGDAPYSGPESAYVEDTHEVEIMRNRRQVKIRVWNEGAIVDHPDSYRLVQMGLAIPADDECKDRANMSPEMIESAGFAYERLRRGIHFDDFERYGRGELIGYNADGSDIPGPNAATFDDDTMTMYGDDDDDDEDDE